MAALLADGWSVSEPTVPEAHDLLATKGGVTIRAQVKTIKLRERSGRPYYVIRGLKNSGQAYDAADCDVMIGVIGDCVYLTDCTGLSEYWVGIDEVNDKWRQLPLKITETELLS